MRNQEKNSQNHEEMFGISSWEQKSEGMNDIERKRSDFHKEIRKQQIDDIIKAKRKLYFENPTNTPNSSICTTNEKKKRTLTQCLASLESNQNNQQTICLLVNLLALQKPFQHYSIEDKNPSSHMIERFCTNLVNLILTKIIPQYSLDNKKRVFCLNALANLFADPLCPNWRYVKILVQTIDCIYGGIDIWGVNQEMIEIYYMIANLMRKNIVQTDLLSVEKLLAWAQTGISLLPSDPLKSLIQGCAQFYNFVDQHFNSRNKNSLFTDHFRPSRQIIIDNLIKRVIQTANGSKVQNKGSLSLDSESLLSIFKFFNQNKEYILKVFSQWQQDQEDKLWIKRFIDKMIHLINQQTLNSKTLREIGDLFKNLLAYYPEKTSEFGKTCLYKTQQDEEQYLNGSIQIVHKQLLTPYYLSQIMISICHQSSECKITYLNIMRELLCYIQRSLQLTSDKEIIQAFEFILIEKRMEDILSDYIADMNSRVRNVDILKAIVEIYQIVINAGNGKLGQNMMQKFKYLIDQGSPYVPEQTFLIIDELIARHQEKINTLII